MSLRFLPCKHAMHATITVLIFVGVLFFVFFCFFMAHEWRNMEGAVGGRTGGLADWRTGGLALAG